MKTKKWNTIILLNLEQGFLVLPVFQALEMQTGLIRAGPEKGALTTHTALRAAGLARPPVHLPHALDHLADLLLPTLSLPPFLSLKHSGP